MDQTAEAKGRGGWYTQSNANANALPYLEG